MVKKIIILISALIAFSCASNAEYFKETESEKTVKITYKVYPRNSDSVSILVPLELKLNLNKPKVKDVGVYYVMDGEFLNQITDFFIMGTEKDNIIYAIEDLNHTTYPKSIYLLQKNLYIPKIDADRLLKKYHPELSVYDIKYKDTLELASYKQFKKDFPEFIEKLREEPDSVIFSIGLSSGKTDVVRKRINW